MWQNFSQPSRIVVAQALLGALSAVVFFVISTAQARSALIATGCVLIPTAYYAWVSNRTLDATRLLAHGVMRMVLTGVLVAVAIVSVGIEPAGFFATFCVVQLAYLAPGRKVS